MGRAPDHGRLQAICTDRGQHSRRVIGWLCFERKYDAAIQPSDEWEVVLLPWFTPAEQQAGTFAVKGTLPLRCPTCRRNVPLGQRNARRLLDAFAGVETIDISNIM